jgi:hypothetical protein
MGRSKLYDIAPLGVSPARPRPPCGRTCIVLYSGARLIHDDTNQALPAISPIHRVARIDVAMKIIFHLLTLIYCVLAAAWIWYANAGAVLP